MTAVAAGDGAVLHVSGSLLQFFFSCNVMIDIGASLNVLVTLIIIIIERQTTDRLAGLVRLGMRKARIKTMQLKTPSQLARIWSVVQVVCACRVAHPWAVWCEATIHGLQG